MEYHHDHKSIKNIKVAFMLNFTFTIVEIIGGLLTNSMAILSDALHDFGDSISLGIAWYLENFSRKKPDQRYTYGYARFSLLAALINSLVLVGGSILILSRAIPRIISPEGTNAKGMFLLSILGIIMNGIAVLRLKQGTSLNEKVVSWHLLEDVLGWSAIFVVSIVLMFKDIPILDPILSVLITLFILYNVIKNLKDIFKVFLEGVPIDISIEYIENEISQNIDAISVHHTHIWTLDGEINLMSTHVVVKDDISHKQIIKLKQDIREQMEQNNIQHVTIEIEFESEGCPDRICYKVD
ncbi:MAG: cation diffusion facilitator family transporter [Clostridia bacterium]|nr:cation diffusion facilitator family transporter [Clostridia bacterium]